MLGSLARVFVIGDCDQPRDIRPVTPFIARIEIEEIRRDGQDKNILTGFSFLPHCERMGPHHAGDIMSHHYQAV